MCCRLLTEQFSVDGQLGCFQPLLLEVVKAATNSLLHLSFYILASVFLLDSLMWSCWVTGYRRILSLWVLIWFDMLAVVRLC